MGGPNNHEVLIFSGLPAIALDLNDVTVLGNTLTFAIDHKPELDGEGTVLMDRPATYLLT